MKTKLTPEQRRIWELAKLTLRLEDMIAEALPVVEQSNKRLAGRMRRMIKDKLEWEKDGPLKC
jgi:hypothetical protein